MPDNPFGHNIFLNIQHKSPLRPFPLVLYLPLKAEVAVSWHVVLVLMLKLFSQWVSKQRCNPFPTSSLSSHGHTTTSKNARHIQQGWAGLALLTPSTEKLRAGQGREWSEKGQWDRTVAPSAWLCQRWNLPWSVSMSCRHLPYPYLWKMDA